MIRSLRLRNFKCFEDQTIEFGPLTLLAGLNGQGKPSVLQVYFTPGAGRIFFFPQAETRKFIIGHIGSKLPNVSY